MDLGNFGAEKASVRYACAKQAISLSLERPAELYPDFDFFLKLLQGENKILKWTAIQVIGNLSRVDSEKKLSKVLPTLFSLLKDPVMITAANAIKALAEIGKRKPEFREDILNELLKVEKARYLYKGKVSRECRNVAIGHVLNTLDKLWEAACQRDDVRSFLKRQIINTRPKVRERAQALLKKLNDLNA